MKDPVCGMDVDIKEAKKKGLVSNRGAKSYYFCSSGCKDVFEKKRGKTVEILLSLILVALATLVFFTGYMLVFMGVVFLILAFLKFLDLKGFASLFSQYDLLAKRVKVYAKVYPFIELLLGLSFLFKFQVKIAAAITLVVMSVGAIGVAKNMFGKKKMRCACLGAKVKVPLTFFTLVEDIVMAAMGLMVLLLL